MPKIIDYPRASFRACLGLADAVWYLGGSCTLETCADKMNLKISGSFHALCASTQKFKLIATQKGILQTTELYKLIKHSYSEEEMMDSKIKSFLTPPVFSKLFEKFNNKELPVSMLEKILIREFEIDPELAGRIGNYYVDGCKDLGLLGPGNILARKQNSEPTSEPVQPAGEAKAALNAESTKIMDSPSDLYRAGQSIRINTDESNFSVHIVGPGTDFRIVISETDDIFLLEAMIKKIRRKVEQKNIE